MALLTLATVADFARAACAGLGDASPIKVDSELTASEIGGGNLNYAFCVTDAVGGTCFVKQAPDFIKVMGEDAKLHRERMELEVKYYQECSSKLTDAVAADYFPKIYLFDRESMAFVMEFMGSYEMMQDALNAGTLTAVHCEKLGAVLGLLHAKTHSTQVSADAAAKFTTDYKNEVLRGIQLEFLFSKGFREGELPNDGRAAREFTKLVSTNDAFLAELEKLKGLYRGDDGADLALCHGDLHPGSVMVCPREPNGIKIIDPEFCVYGPPGLDVGALLSGCILAFSKDVQLGGSGALQLECAGKLWTAYAEAAAANCLTEAQIDKIGRDSVGFACAEAGRTCTGFAGARAISIEEDAVRLQAEASCLEMCVGCLMGRERGMSVLLEAMTRA